VNDWTAKALAYLEERKVAGDWKARGLLARRDCPRAGPAKQPPATVAHHAKVRRAEERELEEVKRETWDAVLERIRVDHRARVACEGCHKERALEPHHLVLGERTDAPHLVMGLCAGCHRLTPFSAHQAPRLFAQTVVIPWAAAHGFELPNRKEYRKA
jgi:hypothetical protein